MFSIYFKYAILLLSFVLSVICYLCVNVHSCILYLAMMLTLIFVFQLFTLVRDSNFNRSLKKDIYTLAGLLLVICFFNILWVFVFQWFKYVATIASLVFLYMLFVRLKRANVRN